MADRLLTRAAFDALLRWLDTDRDRAGEHYEQLRRKLVKFFDWRGDPLPDDRADETLSRVAGLLAAGTVVRAEEPARFCYGVARMVLLEAQRERQRVQAAEQEQASVGASEDEIGERRSECLSRCLATLTDEARELLLGYYEGAGGSQIARRRALAVRFGIAPGALRLRAYRLREELEPCMRTCLEETGER